MRISGLGEDIPLLKAWKAHRPVMGHSTLVRGWHTFIRVVLFWMVLLEPVIERGTLNPIYSPRVCSYLRMASRQQN